MGCTQLCSSMNSDKSLQDDFCYQIAGPHYWQNLLQSSFPIRAQRGSRATCCNGRQYGRWGESLGELRGGETEKDINSCFIVCNSNPSFVHHHPTQTAEMDEGAVTAPSIFPVQTQYDVTQMLTDLRTDNF